MPAQKTEALKERLKQLNDLDKESGANIDQTSSDDNEKVICDLISIMCEHLSIFLYLQMESIGKNGSIAERLALLKSNGENNWRKRVTKKEISDEIIKKEVLVGVRLAKVGLRLALD